MSNDNAREQLLEILDNRGIKVDPEALRKADKIQAKYGQKPSMSKLLVRRALHSMIMFVNDNRDTILPYVKASFDVINKSDASEDEMLTVYIKYMLEDFKAGACMMTEIAEAQGFARIVTLSKERAAVLEQDVIDSGGESAVVML